MIFFTNEFYALNVRNDHQQNVVSASGVYTDFFSNSGQGQRLRFLFVLSLLKCNLNFEMSVLFNGYLMILRIMTVTN